jgi:hypothetical protein
MLTYGNPNRALLPYMKQESFLDSLLSELYSYPYPDNNGQEVIDEINQLINLTNSIADSSDTIEKNKIYDTGFKDYIVNVLGNVGVDTEEVANNLNAIDEDIMPIIVKLKYYYQRIRPNQLAHLLQMNLYPFDSKSADTPAYPSGHTFNSKIYCAVLGNKYPKYYQNLIALAQDCSDSRMFMGLHYASDITFGSYAADCVLDHPEFKKKYKL